jgi:threonine synthase
MFSLQDPNIHNIAVQGVFDDCQDLVKAVSADPAFKRSQAIGTVNSINWARLVAQVVYYFAGWFQATASDADEVDFAVPTGNFGNICSGHIARSMGLPIRRLVLATNENDVLDEFFRTGATGCAPAAETHETSSPSMDISKASNFERFVFDAVGRDPERTRGLFAEVEQRREFALTSAERAATCPSSAWSAAAAPAPTGWRRSARCTKAPGEVIDPHTADALKVARRARRGGHADGSCSRPRSPAKFGATVHEAIGIEPPRPARFAGIEALPRRFVTMPVDVAALKAFIAENG